MARITRSAGNVFGDLGFDSETAEHLRLRSALMAFLRRMIEERGLTQREAADLFGVTQPRVSDMVRGKIDLFTIDSLVQMAAAAGYRLEIRARRAAGR